MHFVVHTDEAELERMYPGQLIYYTVRPILGLPLKWTTEITQVEQPYMFIDEQRFGPYKLWHHQHLFEEVDGGVLMTDIVHYLLPLGPLGWLGRKLIVENQLNAIFDYRIKAVEEIFSEAYKNVAQLA